MPLSGHLPLFHHLPHLVQMLPIGGSTVDVHYIPKSKFAQVTNVKPAPWNAYAMAGRIKQIATTMQSERHGRKKADEEEEWRLIFAGQHLKVMLPDSSYIELRYLPNLSVRQFKVLLEEKSGIPVKFQVLYLNDSVAELDDEKRMQYYCIRPTTIIYIAGPCFYVNSDGDYLFKIPDEGTD